MRCHRYLGPRRFSRLGTIDFWYNKKYLSHHNEYIYIYIYINLIAITQAIIAYVCEMHIQLFIHNVYHIYNTPTCNSAASWRLYSAAPLRDQTTS